MPNKKESLSIIAVKTLLVVLLFTGIGTIIIGGGYLIGEQGKVQNPVIKTGGLEILVDGNLKTVSNIQLPIDVTEAEKIIKGFCEPKNPNYKYDYISIKKVNNEWRIPITNLNCPCYATVNVGTGETSCMKQIPFGTEKEVTITTDKTEYEQGERIKIIVKNNLDEDIYYPKYEGSSCWKVPFGVEYFIQNEWQNISVGKIDPSNPPYPIPCPQYMALPSYHKLASGAMIDFSWDQQGINKGQAMPGKYRIKFIYVLKDKKQAETIYSNEFTIKEKVKDETADWKTYRDGEYGFEFKYPEDWGECYKNTEDQIEPFKVSNRGIIYYFDNSALKISLEKNDFEIESEYSLRNFFLDGLPIIFGEIGDIDLYCNRIDNDRLLNNRLLNCKIVELSNKKSILRDDVFCTDSPTGGDVSCGFYRTLLISTENQDFPTLIISSGYLGNYDYYKVCEGFPAGGNKCFDDSEKQFNESIKKYQKEINDFNQILSSFKFIEK